MKYVVIDDRIKGDCFTEEFDDLGKALKAAEISWEYLSEKDKANVREFCVLESANPDIDADDHLDGNIIKAWK